MWALAALILPWLVRGRWLAVDVVAASAWAAALGAGTAAAAEAIGVPEPRGLVLATVVAGLLAVAIPHLRRIWSGGAVTLGRILCTRNHGHHIPVAAHERPAQP